MEQTESDVKKEIGRICRIFLEISLESYKCFTSLSQYLTTKGSQNSKTFTTDPSGLLAWLKSVTKFGRVVRKHVQDGRCSLLNYLCEPDCLEIINVLHKEKLEKKSQLVSELEAMVQGVLDLSLVKTLEMEGWINKSKSRSKTYQRGQ